jgi:nicotinate-nucleotide adenylyltransferase
MGKPRIGIYAGTFDPIHSGHISFALQAIESAKLDGVCIVPERIPRNKVGVEHFGHRAAMIARAIIPHKDLSLLELPDKNFSVGKTLPHIHSVYPNAQIVLLMGSGVFVRVPDWPMHEQLLRYCDVVVSVRSKEELIAVTHTISRLSLPSHKITIVDSIQPEVSSSRMREALREGKRVAGLLPSVQRYARNEWLYISLPKTAKI